MLSKRIKVQNAIITLGNTNDSGKGRHFKSRFIQPGLAGYPGQFGNALIKKENIDKFVWTLRGKPIIINHKDKIEDKDKVGIVNNVWFNPDDGWYWCDGIIFDDEAINLINNGWSVSCAYDFTKADNSGGTENNIPYDIEFLDGEFNHLALVNNPRYEGANIVFNSKVENEDKRVTIKPNGEENKAQNSLSDTILNAISEVVSDYIKVNNGFITTDQLDENGERKVIWIPENVHYVKPSEKARVLEICDNYKQGDETIYNFEHTRIKPTEEQKHYLKNTVKEINDLYSYKGIAQIEISSSLNSGSWGVCFSPNNTSLISIAPAMYKEKGQEKYDKSVEDGFHPKGTGNCIKSVLVHEIAHAITCNSKNEKFWGKIDSIRSEYLKKIKDDDIDNPDFISNYARVNKYEFVAEAFCQGHLAKKYGKYTKQVMELMNEHFAKNRQMTLALNKKEDEQEQEMWIEGFGFGYPIDEESYNQFRDELNEEKEKEEK